MDGVSWQAATLGRGCFNLEQTLVLAAARMVLDDRRRMTTIDPRALGYGPAQQRNAQHSQRTT